MPATEEQKGILFVLRLLLIEGEDWKRRRGPLAPPAVAKVAAQFSPLTEAQLENYLLYRGRYRPLRRRRSDLHRASAQGEICNRGNLVSLEFRPDTSKMRFLFRHLVSQSGFPET